MYTEYILNCEHCLYDIVTLSDKTSFMPEVHKSGFRGEGHNFMEVPKIPVRS